MDLIYSHKNKLKMTPSEIDSIAKELCKDEYLVGQRSLFVGSLNVPRYAALEYQYVMGVVSVYEYFRQVLTAWAKSSGSQATLSVLQQSLLDNDFRAAAESLDKLDKTADAQNSGRSQPAQASGLPRRQLKALLISEPAIRFQAADILAGDDHLTQNWERFCVALGIAGYEMVQWKHDISRNIITYQILMEQILLSWSTPTGHEANVGSLCDILVDQMKCKSTEENLRKKFGV